MLRNTFAGILASQRLIDIKKEVFRKCIHLCSAFVPLFLAHFYWPTIAFLLFCLVLYCVFESLRRKGKRIPLISEITVAAARKRDENKFVLGPVTLVLGIISASLLWDPIPASVGIFALSFGDGLASLVGKLFGKIKIPHAHGKTVAGSLACFGAVFVSALVVLHSLTFALIIGFAAMIIEVLPLKDFDNLLIPILIGGLTQFLLSTF